MVIYMRNWRLAKSLIQLRSQINIAYPKRDKKSDGSVGDLRHSELVSDHNPNRQGVVCAIDITHDAARGPDTNALSEILTRDARVKYIIWNARIWKARTGQWERYTGPNAHRHHVHISVKAENYDDDRSWVLTFARPEVDLKSI